VTLPRYPDQAGGSRNYTLVGARLLPFEDRNLAFVAYRMREKPVSLLVAAASAVGRMSGRVQRSGALDFYFLSRDGLQIIAWSDRGVSYALVSDVQGSAAASCVVCHGTDAERLKFEQLIPMRGNEGRIGFRLIGEPAMASEWQRRIPGPFAPAAL
jgi:hypothetical protein